MRADVYLFTNGLSVSRSRAQADISGGRLFVNGVNITKCSFDIKDRDAVELRGEDMPYVGRGGLKLKGAMDVFGKTERTGVFRVEGHVFDAKNKICADIGASTGGFTDCLLRSGAVQVYAVDCGSGQLHPMLRDDPRVVNIEGFNARELTPETLGELCDCAVMDVSFISQTILFPAVSGILKDGGELISLIKPQFEVGRSALGHGGIVRDHKARAAAVKNVICSAEAHGFMLAGLSQSPITGGDGNREYLVYLVKTREVPDRVITEREISEISG